MATVEYKTGVIRGTAMWANLAKEEVIQGNPTGKYAISVIPNEKELSRFISECEEVWNTFKETPEAKGKKLKGDPNFGDREDNEGNTILKFKSNTTLKMKSGEVRKRVVPIFDGMQQLVTHGLKDKIGNGSDVIVSYQLFPFIFAANNFGVSLRLQGIQVVKLVEYGGGDNAASLGFGMVDGGFNGLSFDDAPDDTEDEDDNPFTTDSSDNEDF